MRIYAVRTVVTLNRLAKLDSKYSTSSFRNGRLGISIGRHESFKNDIFADIVSESHLFGIFFFFFLYERSVIFKI